MAIAPGSTHRSRRALAVVAAALLLAASPALAKPPEGKGPPDKGPPAPSGIRSIEFSGYQWEVKQFEDRRVGPGPNYFSDDEDNVWVDAGGRLHLAITARDGRWYAAEVISTDSFGYGTYRWYIDSRVDDLAANVVVGLFTWSDRRQYNHREIDIEFARWNDPFHPGGQYVVQPWDTTGNLVTFSVPAGLAASERAHKPVAVPGRSACRRQPGRAGDRRLRVHPRLKPRAHCPCRPRSRLAAERVHAFLRPMLSPPAPAGGQ